MTPDDFQKAVDAQTKQVKTAKDDQTNSEIQTKNFQAVIDTIANATRTLIQFQQQHQPRVSVTNQKLPTSIKTPDISLVVHALENLKQPLQENKPDDTRVVKAINELNVSIKKLPTAFPEAVAAVEEVTVKNQLDYAPQFNDLGKAIRSIDVKPVINIPPETPDDYTPIIDSLASVVEAIQSIKIPKIPSTDLTPLIEATASVRATIEGLRFPVPNYILPFTNTEGAATQAPVPLIDRPYDYVGFSDPDANNNYQTIIFNNDGSGGTTVRTLNLTFDASNNVTSISRT